MIITHVAFYSGWSKAWAVFNLAKEIWKIDVSDESSKEVYQASILFTIGHENTEYKKYFIGQSYLAPIANEGFPIFNVTFEPGCRNHCILTLQKKVADKCSSVLGMWDITKNLGKKLLNFFLKIQLRFLSLLNIGTELVKILDSLI